MVIAVAILGLVVVILAAKSDHVSSTDATPAGNPNGVTVTNAMTPSAQSMPADNSVPAYGATGSPSPYTGAGLPGANMQYKMLENMSGKVRGGKFNAFQSSPKPRGTGLLDPLPDKGTRSKQLLTKDILRGNGKKL